MAGALTAAEIRARLEPITVLAHRVYVGYMRGVGRPAETWEVLGEGRHERVRDGVKAVLEGAVGTAQEAHANWVRHMEEHGWKNGQEVSEERREHPCMVPFDALTPVDRVKDYVFVAAVQAANQLWEMAHGS